MFKNFTKSIRFEITLVFILENIIILFVSGSFLYYIFKKNTSTDLGKTLRSELMIFEMSARKIEKNMTGYANIIASNNNASSSIKKIIGSGKATNIVLIGIKNKKISFIKKFDRKGVIFLKRYKFSGMNKALKFLILSGFGKSRTKRLIDLRTIFPEGKSGIPRYILILNKEITNNLLLKIHNKKHVLADIGVYYGLRRSAGTHTVNHKFIGIGQPATKAQLKVFKTGIPSISSLTVSNIPFYIYNKPIYNLGGRIIGIMGVGIPQSTWSALYSKFYLWLSIIIVWLIISSFILFIFISEKFIKPMEEFAGNIKLMGKDSSKAISLLERYENKESEFREVAKVIDDINKELCEKDAANRDNLRRLEKAKNNLELINNLSKSILSSETIDDVLKIFTEHLVKIKNIPPIRATSPPKKKTDANGNLLENRCNTADENILYDDESKNYETINSIHINIFNTFDKKTAKSATYIYKDKEFNVLETLVDYDLYTENCKVIQEVTNKKDGPLANSIIPVTNCDFKGTSGSYVCYPFIFGEGLLGTLNIEANSKTFFTNDIKDLMLEMVNIVSPVLMKIMLVEHNKELSIIDILTNVYNRRFLFEFAKQEIFKSKRSNLPVSLMMIDIDNFKDINNNFGHDIGDKLLAAFVDDIRNLIRQQDILARYGGDEFIIVLHDTPKENALNVAKKIIEFLEKKQYFFENGVSANLTISAGISSNENADGSVDIYSVDYLIKAADQALYRAKAGGKNNVSL